MSSACTCHTDEWCFYCNMYSPLERDHANLKARIQEVIQDLKSRISDARLLENTKNIQVKMECYGRKVELQETIDQLKEVLAHADASSEQHAAES